MISLPTSYIIHWPNVRFLPGYVVTKFFEATA